MAAHRVDALLQAATSRLTEASATPQLDAETLLADLLGRGRSYFRAWPEAECPAATAQRFQALIEQRRCGEPVHYLIGEREFWSLTLRVTPDVLIPRPDTELLVELALTRLPASGTVLDAGTGSGAIALALATERPDALIIASDNSPTASRVARHNLARHNARNAHVVVADWLASFSGDSLDVVVTNPPYIAPDEGELDQGDGRFEPPGARKAPPDGLGCIDAIIASAHEHLRPGGWLILEHGWQQGPDVRARLTDKGYGSVATHKDLAGHERASSARRGH